MNVCALDTATARLGVAVSAEGRYAESVLDEGLHHTEHLTAELDRLLDRSGLEAAALDLIVCVRGPGSFTGLRIGMAVAKGLSFGGGTPLVSIPSLDLYAHGRAYFPGTVLPVIDARKKRVYSALYYNGSRSGSVMDCTPEELFRALPAGRTLLTGPYAEVLSTLPPFHQTGDSDDCELNVDPSAADSRLNTLLKLGIERLNNEGPDHEARGPLYVRRSEAEEDRRS